MTYQDLDVYRASLDLAEMVYRVTRTFPKEEVYGLTSQMRRAAVSIASNLAEGWGRGKGAANAQFVRTCRGSVYELKTQVELSIRLHFVAEDDRPELLALLDRVGRLVQAYLAAIDPSVVKEEITPYDSA